MTSNDSAPLIGRYISENTESIYRAYHIVMDVKETEKSYILQLIELESRYSANHISYLFSKSNRVVLRKAAGGHAIHKWGDGTFTFYPFQAGIPFYFKQMGADPDKRGQAELVCAKPETCETCESCDCAFNRDGICRFPLVYDRKPNITDEDGCTEFVVRQ